MPNNPPRDLQERLEQAANAVLKASGSVGPLELLLQLGWLAPSHFVSWKKGIIPSLVEVLQVSPKKRESAFRHFEQWALNCKLKAVKVPYLRNTPSDLEARVRGITPYPARVEQNHGKEAQETGTFLLVLRENSPE